MKRVKSSKSQKRKLGLMPNEIIKTVESHSQNLFNSIMSINEYIIIREFILLKFFNTAKI